MGTLTGDTIYGRAGNDSIAGGAGSDFLFGQGANDTLNGEAGPDYLFGGDGDGFAAVDDGDADSLDCGAGDNDRAIIRPGDSTSHCEVVRAIS